MTESRTCRYWPTTIPRMRRWKLSLDYSRFPALNPGAEQHRSPLTKLSVRSQERQGMSDAAHPDMVLRIRPTPNEDTSRRPNPRPRFRGLKPRLRLYSVKWVWTRPETESRLKFWITPSSAVLNLWRKSWQSGYADSVDVRQRTIYTKVHNRIARRSVIHTCTVQIPTDALYVMSPAETIDHTIISLQPSSKHCLLMLVGRLIDDRRTQWATVCSHSSAMHLSSDGSLCVF